MSSQTEMILDYLRTVRPFSRTSSEIFVKFDGEILKVSVNRALNELKARGVVLKKDEKKNSPGGRKEHLWRANYRE